MRLTSKTMPGHIIRSKHLDRLGCHKQNLLDLAITNTDSDFLVVEPSLENVNATIKSYDNANFGEFRNQFLEQGCKFLRSEYSCIFRDPISNSEEISHETDWTKSGGYTSTFYGIKTKGDLVQDPGYLASDHHNKPYLTIPMTTVANKIELKVKRDILQNKIRQFFISEYHLFKSQIKFGKRSSKKLLNFKWSAYGFSPFMGGVNRMAKRLLSKRIRFFYDVSGWDKFIPLMKDLYLQIMGMTKEWLSDDDIDEFLWMIQNTIEFFCVLYDGDIVLKKYGNASGSGTTTRDNILMHIIIAAAFLSEAYYIKMGSLPTFQLLTEQIVKLFGDDSVFAVDIEFDYVLFNKDHEDGFLNSFFKRMGMKLKFLYGGEDYDIEKMSFLGFTFKMIDGIYLPLYDSQRLATSFLHTNDKKDTLEAYVSKLFVLTMMSFAGPHFDKFFKAYNAVIDTLSGELTPELQSFYNLRLTPEVLWGFYTGAESGFACFTFFEQAMEAEGRNLRFFPHVCCGY